MPVPHSIPYHSPILSLAQIPTPSSVPCHSLSSRPLALFPRPHSIYHPCPVSGSYPFLSSGSMLQSIAILALQFQFTTLIPILHSFPIPNPNPSLFLQSLAPLPIPHCNVNIWPCVALFPGSRSSPPSLYSPSLTVSPLGQPNSDSRRVPLASFLLGPSLPYLSLSSLTLLRLPSTFRYRLPVAAIPVPRSLSFPFLNTQCLKVFAVSFSHPHP